MDPAGEFQGDTLHAWWNPVPLAARYLVVVEQCLDAKQCKTVVDLPVENDTSLELTSNEKFGPCTFYTLKVIAEDVYQQRLLKETTLLNKSPDECNSHLAIIIGVTLATLAILALILGTSS